ncbi:transposase [Streptomyces barringtoniae]|uniref:transposase n=1 Tax=Streptomyces barringtoniae TaxID=2892029 RepID=UPI003556F8EF
MRRPSPPASSRQLVDRLIAAGQWRPGDRDMLIVMDASYDVMRLAWLLRDPPIELVGRLHSDCALRLPAPPASTSPRAAGRPRTERSSHEAADLVGAGDGDGERPPRPGVSPSPWYTTSPDSVGSSVPGAWWSRTRRKTRCHPTGQARHYDGSMSSSCAR